MPVTPGPGHTVSGLLNGNADLLEAWRLRIEKPFGVNMDTLNAR
jgi:hypothetical protein